MKVLLLRLSYLCVCFLACFKETRGQFLIEMIDTTTQEGKGIWSVSRKFDHIRIGGYMQPQFQVAEAKGAKSYSGGDFPERANNRFTLRRGRIRFDFAHFNERGQPQGQLVFQFDGTERGVNIRDFWGRLYENHWRLFSLTAGMFARPFGYEINLSSSDRESPERGRMSQILMRTERDLGMMGSFEPRGREGLISLLKFDVGVFNGQGLTGPREYDTYKDIIARLSLKPMAISPVANLSMGASMLNGGIVQNSRYIYRAGKSNGSALFIVDSSLSNVGSKAPRRYHGFDAQLRINNDWGMTIIRGEYWWGTQSGTETSSETPGELVTNPLYVRRFDGAFFYLLQNIVNKKHQVGLKYDWYDPNRDASSDQIGKPGSNTNESDIRFNTFSVGYNYYMNANVKVLLWYDMVRNERSSLSGFESDVPDNVFTARVQFSF
jgi:hypothetical protein